MNNSNIINFKTMDLDRVSSHLASAQQVNTKFVTSILNGTARSSDIVTFKHYESIFHLRHDAIHWLICEFRDIPFGEKKISSFNLNDKVTNHKYYHLIRDQTPDIFILNNNKIQISELTISQMKYADVPKITKYRLLVDILKQADYDVTLEVIVINSAFSVPDQEFLQTEYGFSGALIESIYKVIENTDKVRHLANEGPNGAEWMAKFRGMSLESVDFGLSDEDVIEFYRSCPNKTFNSENDLKGILTSDIDQNITESDDRFIEELVIKGLNVKSKLTINQDATKPIQDLIKFHDDNKNGYIDSDLRSYMPLPYFEKIDIDSSMRTTWDDGDKLTLLQGRLKESDDHFLSNLSNVTDVLCKLPLSTNLRFEIALDGPGRSKFVRQGSIPHIDSQKKWKNIRMPIMQEFDDHILDMSYKLSHLDTDVKDPLDVRGVGLEYIKICQSIFREVNINALRKERRHKFVTKPTGVHGLYVVLFPGPKLRTGENLSTIWFKLILLKEYFIPSSMSASWIFKTLKQDKNVYHSKWISTDANRLDHYIRCYDKILMAYACYSSLSDRSLLAGMTSSNSNTLGIIIMIYMEDKRSTSKMLQDVRYLVMTALSMFNYYGDVLEKFKDAIRTPLQSFLLSRMLKWIKRPELKQAVLSTQFGRLNVEAGTGDTFDRLSGALINLPRLLTDGPMISFRQLLCEMYFTMLFNKNQDDPTHASFQILSKILEGEESLKSVKECSGLHTGYSIASLEDARVLIDNPHKNQFSRRAIMIGSKLQSISSYNKANSGVAHKLASQSIYINKHLDEFATFKSSSMCENLEYNKEVYQESRGDVKENEMIDRKKKVSEERGQQNRRRRCIEGVAELMEDGYMRSFDLIKDHLREPFYFQIFKKNQIGGVREILILDIHKRVLTNILESFSRVICNDDDRDMLTHGDKKNSLLRDMIRQLKRGDGKKLIMNYNFDKTRWAPSFMPIQFLYMFLPFKKLYPSLFRFIAISLMNHSNKKFFLPEKLIRVWRNDLSNEFQHLMDPNLQTLKEKFLETKMNAYDNESNMGQGILHYTSSYFHLCTISLRDEVYRRMCKRLNLDPGEWRDLVSSDDSYTAHAIPMDSKKKAQLRVIIFMKAQEVVERVMNVWTSTSKSSISMLIYEFNSLFGSNLTMFPTTFKFALSSVHPVNTDSFFRMVKESYISSRQIVENGGTLDLYLLANKLNKIYCESIYHTHVNGHNDLNKFGLRPKYVPYQLGVYPISDPALMIMFGPEIHNYEILSKENEMTDTERHVFQVMHSLVESNDPEVYASIGSIDDVFVGVNRIEAHMGPIKKLERIKNNVGLKWDDMQKIIMDNPLLLFNEPKNMLELKVKVFMKLYKFGAAEALRTTAASIYYGRVSASVSAEAFSIPFVLEGEHTYAACLHKLTMIKPTPMDLKLLYPHYEEYSTLSKISLLDFNYQPRNPLETQNLRMLQLNKMQQRMSNSIVDILNHYWDYEPIEMPPSSYVRDWINLQDALPCIKSSLEETLDSFPGEKDKQIRSLLLIILRLMTSSSKPMKAIIFGPSSKSYDNSYLILKQQNMFQNSTTLESRGLYMAQNISQMTDKLAFAFNYFALSLYSKQNINVSHLISESDIDSFFLNNSLGIASNKKIMLMLLYHGLIDDITSWSGKTQTIFHKWIYRSPRNNNMYDGDYSLKLQLSSTVISVIYEKNKNKITIYMNRVDNMRYAKELIEKAIELSGLTKDTFISMIDKGSFILTPEILVSIPNKNGFHINIKTLQVIKYYPSSIRIEDGYFSLRDMDDHVIMNTIEGLLHTDYIPHDDDIKEDVLINGVSLSKLSKLRPFNTHFSVEHCDPKDMVDLLSSGRVPNASDLQVPKPRVSQVTNDRLGIHYPIRDMQSEFADMFPEEIKEEKIDDYEIESGYDNFMAELIAIPEMDSLYDELRQNLMGNYHDTWIDPSNDIDILKTMTRQVITYQPKKILEKVLNIKYHIITALITNVNLLNRSTIETVNKALENIYIKYAMIYVYDKQFTNTTAPSPNGCTFSLNPLFDQRYKLTKSIGLDD